jgi:tRNA 2-thiouridine synthesizing protein A
MIHAAPWRRIGSQLPRGRRGGLRSDMDYLDLRGVPCPLSWAKAKVRIERLPPGGEIELLLDDPKGVRDLPRAAEAEGYAVIDVERRTADWRIIIHK